MFKQLTMAAIGILGLSLSACAGGIAPPGNLAGLSSDGMRSEVVHKNPFYGEVTTEDYKLVAYLTKYCKRDVDRQTAGTLEVAATNATEDAASGFVGTNFGYPVEAKLLGATLKAGAAKAVGTYVAIGNGAQGAMNGVKQKAAVNATITGNCTNGDLHDPKIAQRAAGLHVYASTIRTNNSSKVMPSWAVPSKGKPVNTGFADTQEPMPEN